MKPFENIRKGCRSVLEKAEKREFINKNNKIYKLQPFYQLKSFKN